MNENHEALISEATQVIRGLYLGVTGSREAAGDFLTHMDEDVVRIVPDRDCESPREWDNAGVMYCRHPRHTLGDPDAEDPYVEDEGVDVDGHWMTGEQANDAIVTLGYALADAKDATEDQRKLHDAMRFLGDPDNWMNYRHLREDVVMCLPIGMYEHSGMTVFHGNPSDWDSGQVGWHYMTREMLDKEFGGDMDKAKACLEAEMRVYDQWLQGNCWSYVIEKRGGDTLDACTGFIGDTLESTGILEYIDPDYREEIAQAWEDRFEAA